LIDLILSSLSGVEFCLCQDLTRGITHSRLPRDLIVVTLPLTPPTPLLSSCYYYMLETESSLHP